MDIHGISLRKKMKNTLPLSPRCAARSRRSRALISLIGQHVLVESGLLDLGLYATPVVPELGGEVVVSNTAYVLVADSYCKLL
jgi:hypothetical protein